MISTSCAEEPVLDDPEPVPGAPGRGGDPGRVRRVLAALSERPVLVTAVLGLAFVALQGWWIHRARFEGAFDVDEAGGIATALRFHREAANGPLQLARALVSTGNGPLVPLLSVPFLVLGPRSTTTAMLVQPALVAIAAVGAAGTARRLAGPHAGLLAGVAVLGLPVAVVSSRSYQNSLGVAAFLSLAVWALVASDRGRARWPMVGFGAAVGAMVISRTMAVGFLLGVGLAALAVLDLRDRRVRFHLAVGAGAALAVAGPWWAVQWDYVLGYIRENAYGDRAHYWGSTSLLGRLRDHLGYTSRDLGLLFPALPLLVAVAAATSLWARRGDLRAILIRNRELVGCWAVVLGGYVALLSTSNLGYWFASPLEVVLVTCLVATGWKAVGALRRDAGAEGATLRTPVVVAALAALALVVAQVPGADGLRTAVAGLTVLGVWALRRRGPEVAATGVVVLVAVVLAASLPPTGQGGTTSLAPGSGLRIQIVGDLDEVQAGNLWGDGRLASTDLADRRRAAAAWAAANDAVVARLTELDRNGRFVETIVGSGHLMGTNTIGIAEEMSLRGIRHQTVVNTLEPPDDEVREGLTPTAEGLPRVLVVIALRSLAFPSDRGHPRFTRLAREEGWRPFAEVPLPDGGEVVVWTHPDSLPDP